MTQPYPAQTGSRTDPPALGPAFARLAGTVQVLLGLTIALQIAMIVADWYYLGLAERLIATPRRVPVDDLERFDTVSMVTSLGYLALLVLTGVAFISWLYQAHHGARTAPDARRHQSFWAVIGWFVPIWSLFRPYQMVDDTRRGADPTAVTPAFQPWWWVAFLIGTLGDRIVAAQWPSGDEPGLRSFGEALQTAARTELGVGVVNAVAAVLAIMVVRELTAQVRHTPQQ